MKKIIIYGFVTLILTGCSNKIEEEDNKSFKATIIECNQDSMIVKPEEEEIEYKSADKFTVSFVGDFKKCNVNDKVQITYKGGINESYPAQIGTIKIEKIN